MLHHEWKFIIPLFQMERLFAGYLASDGDSNRLRNVFRIIPEVMESRLGEKEWDIVISLSNDIFKVLWRYNWHPLLKSYYCTLNELHYIIFIIFQYIEDKSHINAVTIDYSIMAKDFYERTLVYLSTKAAGPKTKVCNKLSRKIAMIIIFMVRNIRKANNCIFL